MPPFIDNVHLQQVVSSQAIPALEAIAANDNLRSFRRFERDDPPPYVSSTESEDLEHADFIVPQGGPQIPEELQAIMERPIDDNEIKHISGFLDKVARAYDLPRGPRPDFLRELNGYRRIGVIARHSVKRRWEKLGVWNPEWGFAGRKVQPGDDFEKWTWWWQPAGAADDPSRAWKDGRDLVARGLRLRQNLRRGEHAPVVPRSRLSKDTTAAQAEAFLISRPWFVFQLELAEERERYWRLSNDDQRRYSYSALNQVIKWWKERGDWREEYNRTGWVTESPSPEPEELSSVRNMKNSPLDAAAEMEFTPSEVDELETIDLPRSEQPEGFWVATNGMPPYFPGMGTDTEGDIIKRQKERIESLEKAKAEGWEPTASPGWKNLFPGGKSFHMLPEKEEEHERASTEEYGASSQLPVDRSNSPPHTIIPPQNRRRPRQRHLRDGVDKVQDQDQLPLPPRRSARIAGMKRAAESLSLQAAPNKRLKGKDTAASKAAALVAQPAVRETRRIKTRSVPARPLPKEKTETGKRRGLGRPRKENGPNTCSAVQRKPTRTPALARTVNSRAAGTDVPDAPRRRGRPRKDK
ncbi:hypothetical protein F5B20DRAFT_593026 [Whalleya microplaca]|nr:hypothetical protein F5B20DRAFT_593026 [Whalleya microplaca]